MAFLNWLDGVADECMRPDAVEFEGLIDRQLRTHFSDAESAANFLNADRTFWRQHAITKSQLASARVLSGTVLEIGAGAGWCSSLLSRLPEVTKVYCLDCDRIVVETLMPQVQRVLNANPAKIERVLGSFNQIPLHDEADFIFAIDALHYSENLFATLAQCFNALKPGGWLVALGPALADGETNAKVRAHIERRSSDEENASSRAYRISEYIAAGYAAKFDVWPFLFDALGDPAACDGTLSNRRCWSGFQVKTLYPYFAKNADDPVFDRLMLMLRRPYDGGHDLGHVLSGPPAGFPRQVF